jgi:hypothetical protein
MLLTLADTTGNLFIPALQALCINCPKPRPLANAVKLRITDPILNLFRPFRP